MREQQKPLIRVIDSDDALRRSWAFVLQTKGFEVELYCDNTAFLNAPISSQPGCILCQMDQSFSTGLELQQTLKTQGVDLPIIFTSEKKDVATIVEAIKQGGFQYLIKPLSPESLEKNIQDALDFHRKRRQNNDEKSKLRTRLALLTNREREVLQLVALAHSNKSIASTLKIAEKTVQVHRASAYRKLDLHSAPEITRFFHSIDQL